MAAEKNVLTAKERPTTQEIEQLPNLIMKAAVDEIACLSARVSTKHLESVKAAPEALSQAAENPVLRTVFQKAAQPLALHIRAQLQQAGGHPQIVPDMGKTQDVIRHLDHVNDGDRQFILRSGEHCGHFVEHGLRSARPIYRPCQERTAPDSDDCYIPCQAIAYARLRNHTRSEIDP